MIEENMISEELGHAGEVSTVTPSLLELDGHRITFEREVPSEELAISVTCVAGWGRVAVMPLPT